MTRARRSPIDPAVAACCLLPLLAGCGQKGPLYLPGEGSDVETEIELPEELDEEETGDEDEATPPPETAPAPATGSGHAP